MVDKFERVRSTFYPTQIEKYVCETFLWQPHRWHFTLANQISITHFDLVRIDLVKESRNKGSNYM